LGADDLDRDPTLEAARRLASELRITRSGRPKRGLFFRAEDFFGFTKRLLASTAELRREEDELSEELSGYARNLAIGAVRGQRLALEERYGTDPDAVSHGESVLEVLRSRVLPRGLYLLDEPETPLSPLRQLALLSLLKSAVAEGSQFLIATHSPILMAFPDARLLWFEDDRVEGRPYESIEHVALTRDFLANPDAFLREL
jgi:predicted ATPase